MEEQVPGQLLEEIRLAYEAMSRIRQIAEGAREAIAPEEVSWDECHHIAGMAHFDVRPMYPVLKRPYRTMKRIVGEGILIPDNLRIKLNDDTFLFADEIRQLLVKVEYAENKDEMRVAFTKLIHAAEEMEGIWRAIYDYAKPVPQEAPRKERQRGGRKRRTHRRRTHRKRTYRK